MLFSNPIGPIQLDYWNKFWGTVIFGLVFHEEIPYTLAFPIEMHREFFNNIQIDLEMKAAFNLDRRQEIFAMG